MNGACRFLPGAVQTTACFGFAPTWEQAGEKPAGCQADTQWAFSLNYLTFVKKRTMRLKHFDQIEAYDAGTLSGAEKGAFEDKLKTDARIRQEYEAFQAAIKVAQSLAFDQLKNEIRALQAFGTDRPGAGGPELSNSLLFKYIAQTSATLPLNLAMASRRAQHAWVSSTTGSGPPTTHHSKYRQMNFVKEYEYSFGWAVADTDNEPVNSAELEFRRGHSLLRSRRPREAAAAFKKVLQSGKTEWAGSARWFLALALLSLGQNAEARTVLQNVAREDTGSYRPLAKELLSKMASGKRQQVF